MTTIDMNSGRNCDLGVHPDFHSWLRVHGIEPNDTFRVEVDTPEGEMTVHQYVRGEDGKVRTRQCSDGITREPVVRVQYVELTESFPFAETC